MTLRLETAMNQQTTLEVSSLIGLYRRKPVLTSSKAGRIADELGNCGDHTVYTV